MKLIINRLNKYFDQASQEQVEQGLSWYNSAHEQAVVLAEEFNLPLMNVVGVISALSPNNKWERNLKDAGLFLTNPSLETKVCTFMGQRKKALNILQASNLREIKAILNGRKTINFWRNIMFPDQVNDVTVDLWMYRASKLDATVKNYSIIEDAVKQASLSRDVLPHEYQAIVWSVIRN